MNDHQPARERFPVANTDCELWRERPGDYYADSIHVTQDGKIGINCGGRVFVMPVRDWHALAVLDAWDRRHERAEPQAAPKCGTCGGTGIVQRAEDYYVRCPDCNPAPPTQRDPEPPRCPICGYTKADARQHMDHHLCKGTITESKCDACGGPEGDCGCAIGYVDAIADHRRENPEPQRAEPWGTVYEYDGPQGTHYELNYDRGWNGNKANRSFPIWRETPPEPQRAEGDEAWQVVDRVAAELRRIVYNECNPRDFVLACVDDLRKAARAARRGS